MRAVNFFIILIIALVCAVSCVTVPTSAPYSFADSGNETASMSFAQGSPGVHLVFFEDRVLPQYSGYTRWDPIIFPAGRELKLTVHASYNHPNSSPSRAGLLLSNQGIAFGMSVNLGPDSQNVNYDVVFECPPLEPGGSYRLSYRRTVPGGRNMLVLTNTNTGRVVHEQEFVVRY